jgi:MSHA type pilus biogenesis protein MshL
MDIPGEDKMKKVQAHVFCLLLLLFCFFTLLSCAPARNETRSSDFFSSKAEGKIAPQKKTGTSEAGPTESTTPEFVPAKEEISPLHSKIVSISARNTPMRDVLYTIAGAANLNLVMERGVNPELPVTMTLNNLTVEAALNVIFDSADYFYSIKNNILTVRVMGTKIFEIGQSNVIQDYQTEVGGDILGGASSVGQSSIKGNIAIKSVSDKVSFQFWDSLDNSLKTLLPASSSTQSEGAQAAGYTINRMAGSVMVTASKRTLEKIENYITNLKKVLGRQVLIEARIVEVRLSEGLKYGIDWSFLTSNSISGIGNINIGAANFNRVVDLGGPNFQIGVTGQDFSALLVALQDQGDVKTLSNPRVNILNGQTALLSVGKNTSFISKVDTVTTAVAGSAPTVTFTIETKSVLSGIIFGIAPYISESGEITLTITPIVSNLVNLEPQIIGSGGNTVEIKLPTVDLREMSTVVKLRDGEMIVIGGLIDKKEKLIENKVPFLGDIPVLGHLFRNLDKSYENTELVMMLTPRIISNQRTD